MYGSVYVNQKATLGQQQALQDKTRYGDILQGYKVDQNLWASNTTVEDFERIMVFKNRDLNGRFFMQDFLTMFGSVRRQATFGSTYGWSEKDIDKFGVNVTGVADVGTATVTITSDSTTIKKQQYDILNCPSGNNLEVVSVSLVGGFETIVATKVGGGNVDASDLAVGHTLGDGGNAWPEKTGQPNGFISYGSPYYNQCQILKASASWSGSAITNMKGLSTITVNGKEKFLPTVHYETITNFQKMRESALMFSNEEGAGNSNFTAITQGLKTRGFVRDVEQNAGAQQNYATALDEADIQAFFGQMDDLNDNEEFLGMAGGNIFRQFHAALADYHDQGALDYGQFNPEQFKAVGIKINKYSYADKSLLVKRYRQFDDADVTGRAASVSATLTDYRDFMLVLNLGANAGTNVQGNGTGQLPYLSMKYKALDEVNRSLVIGFRSGMTGFNGHGVVPDSNLESGNSQQIVQRLAASHVASPIDGDEMYMLSEVGACLVAVDKAHGFIRRTS